MVRERESESKSKSERESARERELSFSSRANSTGSSSPALVMHPPYSFPSCWNSCNSRCEFRLYSGWDLVSLDALYLLSVLISGGCVIFMLWPHYSPPLHILIKYIMLPSLVHTQTSCFQETGFDIHPPYWNPLTLSRVGLLREELNGHDCKTNNTHKERQRERERETAWEASACSTCISDALSNHYSTLSHNHTHTHVRAAVVIFCNGRSIKHIEKSEIPFFDPLPSSCLRQSDAPPLPWRRLAKATSQSCMKRPAHLHLCSVPEIFVNQSKH